MRIFEFVEKGFDGSTNETDHMVKWIAARSMEEAAVFADARGWKNGHEILEGVYTHEEDARMLVMVGVDVVLK